MEENNEHLDLVSDIQFSSGKQEANKPVTFLGVHFMCCDIYARIYANRQGTAYVGNCPKCAKPVRFRIGSNGTNARFFQAF